MSGHQVGPSFHVADHVPERGSHCAVTDVKVAVELLVGQILGNAAATAASSRHHVPTNDPKDPWLDSGYGFRTLAPFASNGERAKGEGSSCFVGPVSTTSFNNRPHPVPLSDYRERGKAARRASLSAFIVIQKLLRAPDCGGCEELNGRLAFGHTVRASYTSE
jgi:hypothetical protein